jgi:hypothetical protein
MDGRLGTTGDTNVEYGTLGVLLCAGDTLGANVERKPPASGDVARTNGVTDACCTFPSKMKTGPETGAGELDGAPPSISEAERSTGAGVDDTGTAELAPKCRGGRRGAGMTKSSVESATSATGRKLASNLAAVGASPSALLSARSYTHTHTHTHTPTHTHTQLTKDASKNEAKNGLTSMTACRYRITCGVDKKFKRCANTKQCSQRWVRTSRAARADVPSKCTNLQCSDDPVSRFSALLLYLCFQSVQLRRCAL